MTFDVQAIRRQFPFFMRSRGAGYLDNAATTQKPAAVIHAMQTFMEHPVGNVHRGQHRETEVSTDTYEKARAIVQRFVNAEHADEIIFTKNCTEGINLVMRSWAMKNMQPGDAIVLSIAEHHSNITPWLQMLERDLGIALIWIDIDDDGLLNTQQLDHVLDTEQVKLVAITGQSNVLGTQMPIEPFIGKIHNKGARILIDAAQLAAHAPIDVTELECDFLAFSGHKIYGPTGIGVLYASREAQKEMQPFMTGGGTVEVVTRDHFTPADGPAKFEAGTPPIIEAIGLGVAIEWQKQFSWKDREAHDRQLMMTAIEELMKINRLRILGSADPMLMHGCVSFTIDNIHPHDLTDILGQQGFALRAGHHCAQPLHDYLKIPASARMSFGLYTTEEEIRSCAAAIKETIIRLRL